MTTEHALTFQDAVRRLEAYWADQGCVIWQPYNVEVGAGTMNPATFLHVLGPEAWNVAYVEPSIRPDDARYGENPNRMGRHHQYQVILKPDPGDPQKLYLDSLAAIGIDLDTHDVRFVEDNWEQPAIGAWGLGWEVWLDGLEITQFTYFQQVGSVDLDPVAVEITYGLDRILMAVQDVAHFKDLRWNAQVTYGDVLLSNEVQSSTYWFELADVERLQTVFEAYEAEAELALAHGLTRPAHEYVLKCSHIFNILDTRGTVGVTERARFFGRMRKLARRVAEAYLAERAALEYPLGEDPTSRHWVAGAAAADTAPTPGPDTEPGSLPEGPADLVIELGCEELPVADLDAAVAALAERAPALLAELRLVHAGLTVGGTPRRLVLQVAGLAPRQTDLEAEVVGPPVQAAYDAEGRPTQAAEGFARSAGVTVAQLTRVEQKGMQRIAAVKREAGRPAAEVLAEALPALIASLPFARGMRWNASGQTFSRPLRWILALHGQARVPLDFAGLQAGRSSRGLRPHSRRLPVAAAEDYRKVMRSCGILIDPVARRAEVARQVAALAEAVGGQVPDEPDLLDEVTNLVEQPRAILGDFEAAYLELPDPVLITVMKKHQRYFPVLDAAGKLMPHFITVAGRASIDPDAVRYGNAAVIRARFADAAYFWKQDQRRKLEDYTPDLAGLSFQSELGSMRDKAARLERLAPMLAARIGLSEAEARHTARAAALAKSDLVTSMVVDFSSLQGVMGSEYALRSGEPAAVATAILEQYLPKGAGDALPATGPGTALALADRFDSLVGLFAAGLAPKGANDPYALRRAALGITRILAEGGLSLDLRQAVDETAAGLPIPLSSQARAQVLDFLARRLEVQLREAGHAADAVAAVLERQSQDPAAALAALRALEAAVADSGWSETLTAYARCARIVRSAEGIADRVDAARFAEPAEGALLAAVDAAEAGLDRNDLAAVLGAVAALTPAINGFFDAVLVMAEDPAVRANRLALVARVAGLPDAVADLSRMEGF
ncbi:MAG: glycine--tRNA ligase subunit beta [Caldilineae bacterium]|nr:glycine--tRNA ligase subunit beta [Caldilineae bacterium]